MVTVDEFLDLLWRSLPEENYRVEVMHHDGHEFRVQHVGDYSRTDAASFTLAYMDGVYVGSATNMERAVRKLYEHWQRKSRAA